LNPGFVNALTTGNQMGSVDPDPAMVSAEV
jgi:hypothetical protein